MPIDQRFLQMEWQNGFESTLDDRVVLTDQYIPMTPVPTGDFGRLVLEDTSKENFEIIRYNRKDAGGVFVETIDGGLRNEDGSSSGVHPRGARVRGNITAQDIRELRAAAKDVQDSYASIVAGADWRSILAAVNSVVYNGNRNYTFKLAGNLTTSLSEGMKLRGTRTLAAPTKAALFDGVTQTLTRATASLNKFIFNDNFTLLATVKFANYPIGTNRYIFGRGNADSSTAWGLFINDNGYWGIYGGNGGNFRIIHSKIRLKRNREYKLRASWANGVGTLHLDGQLIETQIGAQSGTPTTVGQTGDFAIGQMGINTASKFNGEVSQVAVFDKVLSTAEILAIDSQGIIGNEPNLKSAWSLDSVITDLNTTTPNDLTNNGSTPFVTGGGFGNQGVSANLEYGQIVTKPTFTSNETTFSVQAAVGCAFPTKPTPFSALAYATNYAPIGFPRNAILLNSYNQNFRSVSQINPGQGDSNLDIQGTAVGVYVPFDMEVEVAISIGVGSTADFEFGVGVRVDNVNVAVYQPQAAPGLSVSRATVRTATFTILLTAGYHKLSPNVGISSGANIFIGVNGVSINVDVPLGILA